MTQPDVECVPDVVPSSAALIATWDSHNKIMADCQAELLCFTKLFTSIEAAREGLQDAFREFQSFESQLKADSQRLRHRSYEDHKKLQAEREVTFRESKVGRKKDFKRLSKERVESHFKSQTEREKHYYRSQKEAQDQQQTPSAVPEKEYRRSCKMAHDQHLHLQREAEDHHRKSQRESEDEYKHSKRQAEDLHTKSQQKAEDDFSILRTEQEEKFEKAFNEGYALFRNKKEQHLRSSVDKFKDQLELFTTPQAATLKQVTQRDSNNHSPAPIRDWDASEANTSRNSTLDEDSRSITHGASNEVSAAVLPTLNLQSAAMTLQDETSPALPQTLTDLALDATLTDFDFTFDTFSHDSPSKQPTPAVAADKGGKQLRAVDEAQIKIVHEVLENMGDDYKDKKRLWQDVLQGMNAAGYTCSRLDSLKARWCGKLRQVCLDRGDAWASKVMQKQTYAWSRKRKSTVERSSQPPKSTKRRKIKRARREKSIDDTIGCGGREVTAADSSSKSYRGNKIWQGVSQDITELAWDPQGRHFIAGSVAVDGEDNQPTNLVVGSLSTKTLKQFPDAHATTMAEHSSHCTITAVHYSQSGERAYTAGYDKRVRLWDLRDETNPRMTSEIKHGNKVILMAVSNDDKLLATALRDGRRSLQIHGINEDHTQASMLHYPFRSDASFNDYPMCLKFGTHGSAHNFLVAGFGEDSAQAIDAYPSSHGRLAAWTVDEGTLTEKTFSPNHLQVFDVAWFPNGPGFAVGSTVSEPNSQERSCVQLYKFNQPNSSLRLSCPAADMNSVTISPYRNELVTASCTDGKTYVWDTRHGQKPVHVLSHDISIRKYPLNDVLELEDAGVCMTEWAYGGLYTGSSDGIVKQWNPDLSTQNVLVEDTVYDCGAEVISGRFSPDQSIFLLGDSENGLHLLHRNKGGQDEVVEQFESQSAWKLAGPSVTAGSSERYSVDDDDTISVNGSKWNGSSTRPSSTSRANTIIKLEESGALASNGFRARPVIRAESEYSPSQSPFG